MTKLTEYLKNGDQLKCNQGDVSGELKVTNEGSIFIKKGDEKERLANGSDKLTSNIDPLIKSFGVCKLLNGNNCVPVLIESNSWVEPKSNVTIKKEKILLKTSQLMCNVGGTIKYSDK